MAILKAGPASSLAPYASALLRGHVARGASAEALQGALLVLDIVDSTGLANRHAAMGPEGAETLGEALAAHLRPVFDLIAGQGGDIVAMEGDSVTVLWRDGPGLPPAAGRAAAAALALRDRLRDSAIRQRILVTAGALHALPLALGGGRRLLLLAGPPLRALAGLAEGCAPGEVALQTGIAAAVAPDAAPLAEAPGPDSALAPYLPPGVAQRAALGQAALAEFRTLTAVMLRLDGLLPEAEGGQLLAHAVRVIEAAVEGLGLGIAEIVEGDKGVVVVLTAGLPPFVLDQNAAGALEAARRVAEALRVAGIAFGAGVATGRAFTGDVGTATRRMRIVLGPVMSLAARLMQAARSEVLADPETVAAGGAPFVFDAPFALQTKGRAEPVPVRRLAGRAAAAAAPRADGALVGREAEEVALARFIARTQGGLAVIEGEPGVGKSRLLAQAPGLAAARGAMLLPAAAQAIEQDTAYFAFRQALAALLGLPAAPDPAATAARIDERLAGDPLLARAEVLSDLLPVDPTMLGPQERMTGAARPGAVAELFLRLLPAGGDGVVLLLDDAQWLDSASAQLLLALLRRAPALHVVAGTRPLDPDARPDLRGLLAMAAATLRLSRLDRAATGEMVRGLLGTTAIPLRLADHIHARSEGLPLHAEQLVLAMRERGLLTISADGRQVEADLAADTAVQTLRDVILRRVEMLAPPLQAVLKVASVLGRTLEPALLDTIHPDGPVPGAALGTLAQSGLLAPEGAMLGFRHLRIQEAVYELLPFAQRRSLHRAAALAVEALHHADIDRHCAALATHWERAGDAGRGAAWRLRAARRAFASFANLDVLAHVRAIEQAGGHDALLPAPADRIEYTRLFGIAAEETSDFATADHWLMRCAALEGVRVATRQGAMIRGIVAEAAKQALLRAGVLRPHARPDRIARSAASAALHMRFSEHGYFQGDPIRLLHGQIVAVNEAERGRVPREQAAASGGLAIALSVAGLSRLAAFYSRRAIEIGGTSDAWTHGIAYLLSAVQGTTEGDWPRTIVQSGKAADIFTAIGEHYRCVTSQVMLTYARLATGDLAGARDLLLPFGEFAEALDNPPARGWTLMARALMDLMSGAPPQAALDRLSAVQEAWLSAGERVMWHALRSAASLAAGDRAGAEAAADVAIGLMRRILGVGHAYHAIAALAAACLAMASDGNAASRSRALEAVELAGRYARRIAAGRPYALWNAGQAARLRGDVRKAGRLFRSGLALAEQRGMPFEAALCLRALGEPARAAALLAPTGMNPWLEFPDVDPNR